VPHHLLTYFVSGTKLQKHLTMSAYIDVRLTNGKWLTLQRMSVFTRLDFAHHLKQAYAILSNDPHRHIRDAYLKDDRFRHHCDQCLQLHNIPPDLISDDQFIALLFGSESHPLGVLNQFNFDLADSTANAKAPQRETKGSILGKLFRATGDVLVALKMANELPVDVLEDMFTELKPQEEKYKEQARHAIQGLGRVGSNPTR